MLLVDLQSGTTLGVDKLCILDVSDLDQDQTHAFDQEDHTAMREACEEHAVAIPAMWTALIKIQQILDQQEWNADAVDAIAEAVRSTGFLVRDTDSNV